MSRRDHVALFPPRLAQRAPAAGDGGLGDLLPPVFTPTVSRPLLDDFSLRAARARARAQPPGISSVFPLPMRSHPMWAGNNELGRQVPFAPDTNNEQTILKLEEWGPPEDWTVTLGLDIPPENLTTNGWDTTAIIEFGSGGVVQTVELDWLAGNAITLPMNALSIIARYNFVTGGEAEFGPPNGLQLRVSVTRGSVQNARPTRSYTVDGEDGQAAFLIPPFAKAVSVFPQFASPAVVPFSFYSQTQNSRGYLAFTTQATVGDLITVYEYSQLLTYLDLINEVCGAPATLPVPSRARYLVSVDSAGNLTADNRIRQVQFLLGL